MNVLKEYYNNCKKKIFSFCLVIWAVLIICLYFIDGHISQWATAIATILPFLNGRVIEYVLNLLLNCIAPTSFSIVLYVKLLDYVNEKRWKKKFPQYDIDGEWYDKTTYTKQIDGNGWKELKNQSVPSPVIIKQTCKAIKICSSVGKDFRWYSLLAEWDDIESLKIFYVVEYYAKLQKQGYPENRKGYEYMTIKRVSPDSNEKPKEMVGKFWHCISNDQKPMYMGDVTYTRKIDD